MLYFIGKGVFQGQKGLFFDWGGRYDNMERLGHFKNKTKCMSGFVPHRSKKECLGRGDGCGGECCIGPLWFFEMVWN